MADLPKGRITGRFMHITADSEDGDANPDFTPAAQQIAAIEAAYERATMQEVTR